VVTKVFKNIMNKTIYHIKNTMSYNTKMWMKRANTTLRMMMIFWMYKRWARMIMNH